MRCSCLIYDIWAGHGFVRIYTSVIIISSELKRSLLKANKLKHLLGDQVSLVSLAGFCLLYILYGQARLSQFTDGQSFKKS